ncbi:hypothetical protein SASPL_146450 [Salvia splendens]|uniref:Aspergillus nuclease S1 n=1 Tax=Salvia splendens TaxID=180675 RepID=A0A8X8Z5Q8_SALSN|nr:hypothetical protein SASPL_146450 [Salvia splendens]
MPSHKPRSPTPSLERAGQNKHRKAQPVAWSKEGHAMTCKIAQDLLEPEENHAVQMLLPDYAKGDLSSLCVWSDQVRHWYKCRWTSPLHFIDSPDQACNFKYQRDCHDAKGVKDMCVAGAIRNFTEQLSHYHHGSSDRRYNMTEALLFLAHFMGDIHQPMHVGFTSDEGGNTVELRWFRHKYAAESLDMACKWDIKVLSQGRLFRGGVRLAMILNRVFAGDSLEMEETLVAT